INVKFDGIASIQDSLRAKLVVFRNSVDDYIDMVERPDLPCTPGMFGCLHPNQYTNIPQALLEGIEFEAVYDATTWFMGLGAHRIRGKNEDTGNPLSSVPPDQVTLTLGIRAFDEKLVAGARTRFVAGQD